MDDLDRRAIDSLQDGFPVCERPYLDAAQHLGTTELDLLARLDNLLAEGTLTRFGPLFQVERMGGAFLLAAMRVPEERFDEVAATVNALPEVAHNYARTHPLNMWFVLAAETLDQIDAAIAAIEAATGLAVTTFPKEREFFVELKLGAFPPERSSFRAGAKRDIAVTGRARETRCDRPGAADDAACAALDRAIVRATQAGLPLLPRPYHTLAAAIGSEPELVMARIETMLGDGRIRRIAAVPNHYALGYRANGMSVWDVADERVDELGARVGALVCVSHCYKRPRRPPQWRYNLFAMLHGRDRAEVESYVASVAEVLGSATRAHDVLYSTRILKKTGLRLCESPSGQTRALATTA